MLGISFAELSLILIIALFVVGPKRLGAMAYKVGNLLNRVKIELKHLKEQQLGDIDTSQLYQPTIELNKTLDEIKRINTESAQTVNETSSQIIPQPTTEDAKNANPL